MLKMKMIRKNMGLTQEQVAKLIGRTTRTYQRIESGQFKSRIDVWDKLEDIFHVPQRELRSTVDE